MIIRSKAPLRLGLAGGGTDVSPYSDEFGGRVLNATIDMHAYCTLKESRDNTIYLNAVDRDETFQTESVPFIPIDDELALHKGVYNRVVSEFNNGEPLSFEMTTYSDAQAGSGIGSSSTMVVAILNAFVEWLNLPLGEYEIARLAYEIERKDLNLSGGKQDQYAATFGGFNFMELYTDDHVIVNPLRVKPWIIDELESSLILYFTGVSRESAQIIDEQTKNVREKNNQSVEAMHQLKKDAIEMKEVLLKGNMHGIADCLGRSWEAKKKMAGAISNSDLDELHESALDAGAISGKISGAGGGGFMMLFVEPTRKVSVVKKMNEFDGKVFPFHFTNLGTVAWKIYD